jgi:hypothetical protein
MSAGKKSVATRVASPTAVSTRVDSPVALSDALRAYLDEAGRPGEVAIGSLDDAERALRQHMDSETASRVMQGYILACVQAAGGESLRELSTRVDMSHETVRQLVSVFRLFQAAPSLQTVRNCAQLEFSIAREVAKWPHEQQIAFVAGDEVRGITIADAKGMSAREFAAAARDPEVERLKKQAAAKDATIEGLQADLKEAEYKFRQRYESLKMPDFAAHARQESVALAEQMMLTVVSFEELVTEQLGCKEAVSTYPEWRERAAGTLYHSLRAAHARAQQLLERLEEEFGASVTGKVDYEHTLSAGELLLAKDALGVILKRHQAQASNREAVRKNAKGERGRPRMIRDEA